MIRKEWLKQAHEDAIEPDLPIIDAHHHIWSEPPTEMWQPYHTADLIADIAASGHNIIGTVYTDSHSNFRKTGPEHLRVVGEVEFAGHTGDEHAGKQGGFGVCSVVVSHADLTLGAAVGEVLDAQIAASARYRGIRHMTAIDPDLPPIYGATETGIMMRPQFREGFAELVRRGLSFDAWMFHPQLPELLDLAHAFPDANIILDHTGGPIGVGRFAGKKAESFTAWKKDMAELATCPNISVKLGGLNMSYTAMDAIELHRPHTSDRIAELQRDHMLTTIDLFGPQRCMFESNFPVDKLSTPYGVIWNAFKKMTADMSAQDRTYLFSDTARRVYRF